ncbi:MAG TPA: lysophospholipid acyltransferase family protein [Solirubrobacteraceae bacterium]|jgi:1-acyl-sn-glycerol-3-phosphate acyltransferase
MIGDAFNAWLATAGAVAGDFTGDRPDDPLQERDPEFIRATLPAYSALTRAYFRPKVRGLEHIPAEGPVLLVGNHSGGSLIADTFAFAYAFYEHFGADRLFHQLAHDMVFKIPGLAMLRRYGTVPANHENAQRALANGAALLVYPGGDHESYRPTFAANEVDFGGRSGFVKTALDAGVPIVPVVAIGGQETALFLTRGTGAAKALGLDRLFRLKVLPLQIAPPYGITLFDLPGRIPLPAQITVQVLPPIDLRAEYGAEPDRDAVAEAIIADMQRALDELAEERDLPVVGSVTPRREDSPVAEALQRERRSGTPA